MVVDSCLDRDSGEPASLLYLGALGVDPRSVTRIVATDWHDDHTRGLSDVLKACEEAEFYVSRMLRRDELLELVETGRRSLISTSGTSELAHVLATCEERRARTGRGPRFVGPQ